MLRHRPERRFALRPLHSRWVLLVMMLFAAAGLPLVAHAQDEQASTQTLLKQAVTDYKAKQFSKAQSTLSRINRDKLSDAEKKDYDVYVAGARVGVAKQAEAANAFEQGLQAMKANDFKRAQSLFDEVAKNQYVIESLRKDAEANRMLATRKAAMAKTQSPAPAAAAATPATPTSQPATVADVIPDDAASKPAPSEVTAEATAAPANPPTEAQTAEPAAPVAAAPTPSESVAPAEAPTAEPVAPVAAAPTPSPEPVVTPVPAAPAPVAEPAAPASVASTPEVAPAAATVPATPAPAANTPAVAKAKDLMIQADQCLDAGNVDKAITLYEQAVAAAPEYEPAKVGLTRAQSMTGQSAGLAAIGKLEQERQVRKQETDVRYAQSLQRSREAVQNAKSSEDFAHAADEVNNARMLLSTNKSLFTDAEYREKMVQTDELSRFVDIERTRWEERRVASERQQVQQAERDRRTTTQRQQKERVDALKAKVNALVKEQKYADAVQVLEQIQRIDPKDPDTLRRLEEYRTFVLLLDDKQAHKDGLDQEARQFVDVRQAQIPWYQLLMYPSDWPEITKRRPAGGADEQAESEVDRAVHRRLMQVQKRMELTGVRLEQAIDYIRDISGTSIHVKWATLEQAGVTKDTTVTVKLQDVTIDKALRTILEDVGGVNPLSYVVSDGVITISTKEDLSKETITRVYDIRDLIVSVPNFDPPSIGGNLGSGSTGGTSGSTGGTTGGSSGGSTSFGSSSGSSGSSSSSGGNNGPSRDDMIKNILDLVETTIAPETWIDKQGTIGSMRELNGNMIVTQTSDNHRALIELLTKLRESKALQINIEARFITVSTSFLDRIGIDLNFYFNVGSQVVRTGATDPLTGAQIVNTGAGAALPQWNGQPGGGSNFSAIPVTQNSSAWTSGVASGVGQNIGGDPGVSLSHGLNIAGTFLDDIQVDFLLQATQANQSTRTLQAPRLTIYNTQRAYVTVATLQAYVSGVTPIVVENVAAYQPTVSQVMTGTVLGVEGTISADRRYVTMTLYPQLQNILGFTSYSAISGPGNQSAGNISLPNLAVEEVRCTVSVPDGGTLLLGGLKQAGEQEREMGVPIISKIPVLNRLTTNRSLVRDESSTLILVKPKIIIQKEQEELAFP